MSIPRIVTDRSIEEILHFTTNKGSLGILDGHAVKPRARLDEDERLEYIFQPNAADRSRDAEWLDYVNLSISQPNTEFFSISAGNWHRYKDLWWCVLSFDPQILTHAGAVFTTSNNIWSGCSRAANADGLEAMFAEVVYGRYRTQIRRAKDLPLNRPTSEQAEVLYPGELSTDYLRKIYVPSDEIADEVVAQMDIVSHRRVEVEVKQAMFANIR
ncbi:DarT ssDNA thymidine ADP-ribosyltransferase family protein [Cupriavidus taiwanensis]|uniref:DarT ssDNA thymidine ADP-ribosyltransferase family protein n=1 Tax=Cupriavidus taiwanensis TaxID=164546 RepID=UPI002541BA82|nr:DarT ssDNA thymidine ADP-ribosyltransferase family protein [Cupriavidus taiwanensis]MDK3022829.1 DarT ssDNA thymidine ADP-ribosyltransferase family protein [Cupriavidus taiwanensis]